MDTPPLPPPGPGALAPEAAGALPLRRLTIREYNNTVADLFGDTTQPANVFPSDGQSDSGFNSPIEISSLHTNRYETAAGNIADAALAANKLIMPTGCAAPAATAEANCAKLFIQQTGRRVFRRPVSAAEEMGLTTLYTQARGFGFDFKQSLAQLVRAMLQAPGFLYHWEVGLTPPQATAGVAPLTSHQIASRLSYFLWETMPDDQLFTAADSNMLLTPAAVEAQARRMLTDARAKHALENFHVQWLFLDNIENLQKSETKFAFYGEPVRASLGPALGEFAKSIFDTTSDGTLKTLLTAPYAYVNAPLAPIYGVTATGNAYTRISLDATKRGGGLFTQAAFLASRATPSASNPIYRGVAVYKRLLCGQPRAVPPVVPEVAPEVATTSTRKRYEAHTTNAYCASCHSAFDAYGYVFENYDAIGAYRDTDGGEAVNAKASVVTPLGANLTFTNAVDMMNQLSQSDEAKWCVTRNWFRYMLGRTDGTVDMGSMGLAYRAGGMTPGFSLREMIVAAVRSMAFRYRTVSPTEGT